MWKPEGEGPSSLCASGPYLCETSYRIYQACKHAARMANILMFQAFIILNIFID